MTFVEVRRKEAFVGLFHSVGSVMKNLLAGCYFTCRWKDYGCFTFREMAKGEKVRTTACDMFLDCFEFFAKIRSGFSLCSHRSH